MTSKSSRSISAGSACPTNPRAGTRGAQANDMVALMEALGHRRFAMVGFDTGMPIGYALAADHPSGSSVWSLARPSLQA